MNDTEALKTALEGREEGFRAIFANNASFLFTHALRILKSQHAAEDAVQETFLSAFKSLASFKGESQLRTWLYRILYNNSLRIAKGNTNSQEPEKINDMAYSSPVDVTNKIMVGEILDQMAERDRSILMMVYWDELPIKEAARILEISENTAKIVLFRARKRFAETWQASQGKEKCHEM